MVRGAKLPQSLLRSGSERRRRSVQMLSFPSRPLSDKRADRPKHAVSDAEIGQLVSAALNDAIAALGDRDPETFLHLRACEAREAVPEMLSTLRRKRKSAEAVAKEYRKAIALQNIELDLALTLVSSVRRYARVCQCEIPDRPTAAHQI
jgi:hypothetical protein